MQLFKHCMGIVAKELTTFDRSDWVIVAVVAAVTLVFLVGRDLISM